MAVSRVTVTTHGKFFSGQASSDLRRELDDIKADVAKDGEQMVKQQLGSRLKNPTGFYKSQIKAEKLSKFNDWLITDSGVVYGPWLETGKYTPPKRFRGYKTFRRVRARLRKQAIPFTQRRIDKLIARWNS